MKTKNLQSGFTLIELLVVISIIGFLSSIVLSTVSDAREKAQVAANALQIRELQNQMAICTNETGNFPDNSEGGMESQITCISNGGNDCLWGGAGAIAESSLACGGISLNNDLDNNLNLAQIIALQSSSFNTGTVTGGDLPGEYAGLVYYFDIDTGKGEYYWAQLGNDGCDIGVVIINGGNGYVCGATANGANETLVGSIEF